MAGDYNSLTKEDYRDDEWSVVEEVRRRNSWEAPCTDVTRRMREEGFSDCWETVGRPGPTSTCRYNTHIDYIFTDERLDQVMTCTQVDHLQNQASDHAMVVATFAIKDL